ncbi:enoyl-CoA hydratase-related protein [Streptomyces akebiae]|uniref:Enoyl-CoA hydratase/isomerase family protein n=1 Tax=Streptomyces akebiae TaxID=2865673 RepID=A0ABX8XLR5_9ACTN|nr:enoyl-CoA hydratase-related protein [Streptomyces akebiae]QYX76574.1 enoyl-CoA hydratase/isomerase family protein [Streptomyces akebiae]
MPSELVHLELSDHVATVTLDSPHNRNALSRQLVGELGERLSTAEADPGTRVVLLRSAHPVFCAGADLAEAASDTGADGPRQLVSLQAQIAGMAKPVVVELGGPVRAGGLGIVGAADIVLAAESVTFALTEVRLGLAPAVISLSLLERLSPRAAAEIFLSARTFGATEAADMGLITRAVPDAELASAVEDTLNSIAGGTLQGLSETKRLLNRDLLKRIERDGEHVARRSAELFDSEEARAAMKAFMSRTRP